MRCHEKICLKGESHSCRKPLKEGSAIFLCAFVSGEIEKSVVIGRAVCHDILRTLA
jgi:hypothetical protein